MNALLKKLQNVKMSARKTGEQTGDILDDLGYVFSFGLIDAKFLRNRKSRTSSLD